jgi:DNA-binding MarR family transcriptional regulator
MAGSLKRSQDTKSRIVAEAESRFFNTNVAYSIMVVSNLIARVTTQGALAGLKLSLSEWRVMRLVSIFGPMSAAEIVTAIGMDKTTVSRMITRLHEAEFLKLAPNAADRRQTLVSLTPAGTRVHDRIAKVDEQFDRTFESLLSPAQLKAFHDVMAILREHAQSLAAQLAVPNKKKRPKAAAAA